MPSVLVLLTTSFPSPEGDTSFLSNEIDELSESFDRVFVFSYKRPGGKLVSLPKNVKYEGALTDSSRWGALTGLTNVSILRKFIRAFRLEMTNPSGGRFRSLGNLLTGVRFAELVTTKLSNSGVNSADEIYVYSFWGANAGLAVPLIPRVKRSIVRFHRFDLYQEPGRLLPIRASLFNSASVLVPISDDGKKYLLEKYSRKMLDPKKVFVSRLGVKDQVETGDYLKPQREGAEAPTIRIVSCSFVTEVKNVARIIPVVQVLSETHSVEWTHFGGGELETALRRSVADTLGDNPNVKVSLRGSTPHLEVLDHYRNNPVDVFLNVSQSEGVPVSIMEALSFGIPVVATNVGGTGELIGEEKGSGILVPLSASDAFIADAISRVVENPEDFHPRQVWEKLANAESKSAEIVALLRGEMSI